MVRTQKPTARVLSALCAVLPRELEVTVHPRPGATATFKVVVSAGKGTHRFVIGWSVEGWPADVERLAALVPDLDVVCAPDLSVGARRWLAQHQLGWVDEVGRASLCLSSGLVVSRELPDSHLRKALPAAWTKATIAAAEATLSGTLPTVGAVERATGLSRGATANALAQLEKFGLLERPGAQRGPRSVRRIVDHNRLLDEYAAAVGSLRDKDPVVLVHRLWTDPLVDLSTEIAPAFDEEGVDWAATGAAASTMLAPYLTDVTVLELYVEHALFADRNTLANVLDGRVVERGHRN